MSMVTVILPILFCLACAILPFEAVTGGIANASTSPPSISTEEPGLQAVLRHSAKAERELLGGPSEESKMEKELSRLAARLRPALSGAKEGAEVAEAFRRVLLVEEGFSYDGVAGNPENFLLGPVLERKRGNCLGLSMLYLALAERISVPFRGVCVPSHCFVRYEGEDGPRNVEFALGGAEWRDERYRKELRIGAGRPYLRSLSGTEMLGVFLKSVGAAYSKKGRDGEALRLYDEAMRFAPGMPETHYNAGVSLQRLGRFDEAAGRYRVALSLDPDLAVARDNLGIVLAMRGMFPEAIAEGRRAVELEPRNAVMRGNLATSYYASGNVEEGIREFRKTVEIDPGDSRARVGLAKAYVALGRNREAAGEFEATRISPNP